jgi:hypothetical protein
VYACRAVEDATGPSSSDQDGSDSFSGIDSFEVTESFEDTNREWAWEEECKEEGGIIQGGSRGIDQVDDYLLAAKTLADGAGWSRASQPPPPPQGEDYNTSGDPYHNNNPPKHDDHNNHNHHNRHNRHNHHNQAPHIILITINMIIKIYNNHDPHITIVYVVSPKYYYKYLHSQAPHIIIISMKIMIIFMILCNKDPHLIVIILFNMAIMLTIIIRRPR